MQLLTLQISKNLFIIGKSPSALILGNKCINCTNHHLPILVLHPLLDLPLQQVLPFSFLPVEHSIKSLLLSKSYKLCKADTLYYMHVEQTNGMM